MFPSYLIRQPQPIINVGDHGQSPLYLMWKLPGNDNPPPYSATARIDRLVEDERQESVGKYL